MKTVYDKASGEILKYIGGNDDEFISLNVRPTMGVCDEEYNSREWYFPNGKLTERPKQQTAVDKTTIISSGSDPATFSDLPIPCAVHVFNEVTGENTIVVDDGVLEFFASIPGTYYIKVTSFPCADYEAVINAV